MANLVLGAGGAAADAYTIDQSLRFDGSQYLSRTPGSATNTKTWTVSFWTKLGDMSAQQHFIAAGALSANETRWNIDTSDQSRLQFIPLSGGVTTTAKYRDPSAWYHLVLAVDTTESVAADRVKVYVNGEQETDFSATGYPTLNQDLHINSTETHEIGRMPRGTQHYLKSYLAEFCLIDGQQLTPSSFGETDSATNQWKPIDPSGLTFGTNGFYQKYASTELANSFTDSSSARTAATHTLTAYGNVNTDTSTKKIGTASAEFDGSGDYLTIPASSQFNLTYTAATFETWVYFDSLPTSTNQGIIDQYTSNTSISGNYRLGIVVDDQGDGLDVHLANGWLLNSGTSSITTGTWYHVAVTWSGDPSASSNFKLYLDGTLVDTATAGYGPDCSRGTTWLGRWDTKYLDGYLDEFRISNVVRYTGNFTPSTSAFTPDANTLLLLHFDGANGGTSFPDDGPHTITAVGDVTNTLAQKKVGDSSIVFDGNDALQVAHSSDFDFGANSFTVECWVRFSSLTGYQNIINHAAGGGRSLIIWKLISSNYIDASLSSDGSSFDTGNCTSTTGLSADTWHHIAYVRDGDDFELFINGTSEDTATSSTAAYDSSSDLYIGSWYEGSASQGVVGYADEIRISDSARYTSNFTPSTTEFTADSNTLLLIHSNWDGGLGADSSGNGNDFAATNLVATDQMLDSPTNNFATLNPLDNFYFGSTLSEGNLKVAMPDAVYAFNTSTIGMSSGKWYWENYFVSDTLTGYPTPGISTKVAGSAADFVGEQTWSWCYLGSNGNKYNNNSGTSYGNTYTDGDIVGVALDLENNKLYFSKNGTWQDSGDPTSGATGTGAISIAALSGSDSWYACLGDMHFADGPTDVINFGQDSSFAGAVTAQGNQDGNEIGDFYYEPPTDYLALCTSNLDAPSIALPGDNFNTVLYTGDGATTLAVTGAGFAPDFTWIKNRSASDEPIIVDVARGANNYLRSDATAIQVDDSTIVASLDSDGFTVGDNVIVNTNTENYVSWNWLAGGSAVANTVGTVDALVSANTTAGFSIVKFDQAGTGADATIGHGLSQRPELVIGKPYNKVDNWRVGSDYQDSTVDWAEILQLQSDGAAGAKASVFDGGDFPGGPTASIIYMGDDGLNNSGGYESILYCFHSVDGYSKVGKYKANGEAAANAPFVYCGFRPAWVMIKGYEQSTRYWMMFDNKRSSYNVVDDYLRADSGAAESAGSLEALDFLSNGFRIRTSQTQINPNEECLFLAFAESPFKYANAR